jgi:hypothetical protein
MDEKFPAKNKKKDFWIVRVNSESGVNRKPQKK